MGLTSLPLPPKFAHSSLAAVGQGDSPLGGSARSPDPAVSAGLSHIPWDGPLATPWAWAGGPSVATPAKELPPPQSPGSLGAGF